MTDASVVSIFDLARQAELSHVGIICTKSDVSCDNHYTEATFLELIPCYQDIQAEEAIRDWRGERARRIQQFMDAIATNRRDMENIQADLADYAADGDLSEGEAKKLFALNRSSEQAKQVPRNPSEIVH